MESGEDALKTWPILLNIAFSKETPCGDKRYIFLKIEIARRYRKKVSVCF